MASPRVTDAWPNFHQVPAHFQEATPLRRTRRGPFRRLVVGEWTPAGSGAVRVPHPRSTVFEGRLVEFLNPRPERGLIDPQIAAIRNQLEAARELGLAFREAGHEHGR